MKKLKNWLSSDFVVIVVIIGLLSMLSIFDDRYSFFNYQANPNPMLIVSMLIAAYRGLRLAAVSSVVIIALYYVNLYYNIDHSTVLSFYEFQYIKTPILIMVLSLLVGELKQRTLNQQDVTEQDLVGKESVLKITRDKNHLLNEEIKGLRKKLIFKKDSLNVLIGIDKNLSEGTIKEVANNFIQILEEQFYVKSAYVEISIRGGRGVILDQDNKRDFVVNSDLYNFSEEESFFHSINADLMISEEYTGPLIVSKNKLSDYGSITCGILDVPFLHFSKQNIEAIELLINWFVRHVDRKLELRHLNQNLDIDPKFQILKRKSFLGRFEDNFEQALAFEREICLINTNLPVIEDKKAFETFKRVVCIKLQEQMRGMDIIGEGDKSTNLWLCYIGDKEHAQNLVDKAKNEIKELVDLDTVDEKLSFEFLNPTNKHTDFFQFIGEVEGNA